MIPPILADAACLAALRGLPHVGPLPTAADLEGYARLTLAQAGRMPGRRCALRGEALLYLRARRAQRRLDREGAARALRDARLALREAERAARVLRGEGVEALLRIARAHLTAVARQAGAALAA